MAIALSYRGGRVGENVGYVARLGRFWQIRGDQSYASGELSCKIPVSDAVSSAHLW